MSFYEAVFIVRQEASSSHVESVAQETISIIKEFNGDVTKTEFCGLRNLAYPINNCKRGHYVLLNIISNPEGIKELERKFRLSEDIIRFLIIKVENLDNNPSALMKRNFKDMTTTQEQD